MLLLIARSRHCTLSLTARASPSPSLYLRSKIRLQLLSGSLSDRPVRIDSLVTRVIRLIDCNRPTLRGLLAAKYPMATIHPFRT